jgi:AcrR family transcriptional regulator
VNNVYFVNVLHESLSPRRVRSRARRHDQILATALTVVAEEGFDALTMARLGEELDLSAGALYRYFASKDALVVALQTRAIALIAERLRRARAGWRADLPRSAAVAALAELLATAAFYLDLAREEPRLYRLVSHTLGDPRLLVDDAEAARAVPDLQALLGEVSELFAEGARSGALDEGDALGRTLLYWSSLQGAMLLGKLARLAPAPTASWLEGEGRLFELARTLLRGWGATPARIDRAQSWLDARRAEPPSDPEHPSGLAPR